MANKLDLSLLKPEKEIVANNSATISDVKKENDIIAPPGISSIPLPKMPGSDELYKLPVSSTKKKLDLSLFDETIGKEPLVMPEPTKSWDEMSVWDKAKAFVKEIPYSIGLKKEPEPEFDPMSTAKLPELIWFDKVKDIAKNPAQLTPFLSSAIEVKQLGALLVSANRLREGTETYEDLKILKEYSDKAEQDSTFGYKVLDTVSMIPAFGLELLATAGVATVGKIATVKALKASLKYLFKLETKDLIRNKLAKAGIRVAAEVGGRALQAPVAGVTRIAAGTVEKQLASTLTVEDINDKEDVWMSFAKSFGEQEVEIISEFSGGLLSPLSKFVKNKLLKTALFSAFQKANPGASAGAFQKIVGKMGYNGVIGEMFEERMADVGHGVLFEIGLGDQQFKLPSSEQLAVELVAFSIPGAAISVVNKALEDRREAGLPEEEKLPQSELEKFQQDINNSLRESETGRIDFTGDKSTVGTTPNLQDIQEPSSISSDVRTKAEKIVNLFDSFAPYKAEEVTSPEAPPITPSEEPFTSELITPKTTTKPKTTAEAIANYDAFVNKPEETKFFTPDKTKSFITSDIQGNQVEQQFIREATKLEQKGGTQQSRGYNKIPDKKGYEKIYKPYGEQGRGYYYSKIIDTPKFQPQEPTTFDITAEEASKRIGRFLDKNEYQFLASDSMIDPATGNIVYGKSVGTLIELLQKNGKVSSQVAFHEAFHNYFNNFLTSAEQMELLSLVKAKYNLTDNVAAEEYLANDFAKYVNTGTTWSAKIKAFFDTMIARIKQWTGDGDKITNLYEDIKAKKRPIEIIKSLAEKVRFFTPKKSEKSISKLSKISASLDKSKEKEYTKGVHEETSHGFKAIQFISPNVKENLSYDEVNDNIINNYEQKYGILNEQKTIIQSDTVSRKPFQRKEAKTIDNYEKIRNIVGSIRKHSIREKTSIQEIKQTKKEVLKERVENIELQIGITNVKGFITQEVDGLVDKASLLEGEGNFKEADTLYKKALAPGLESLKKALKSEKIITLKSSFGRFFGNTEPTMYLKISSNSASIDSLVYKLSKLANEGFKQTSIILHKKLDTPFSEIKKFGVVDEAKGIAIEPAYNIIFTRKVGLKDYKNLSALFDKYELPGATIKPDGSGMEIINLTVYNKNYEKFTKSTEELIKDLHRQGLYKGFGQNVREAREVRHIAATKQDGNTTYERIYSDFKAIREKTSIQEIKQTKKEVLKKLPPMPIVTKKYLASMKQDIIAGIAKEADIMKKISAKPKVTKASTALISKLVKAPIEKITTPERKIVKAIVKAQAKGSKFGKKAGVEQTQEKAKKIIKQRKFLKSLKIDIAKGLGAEKRGIRQKIGFQKHFNELGQNIINEVRKAAGIENWNKANLEQLREALRIFKERAKFRKDLGWKPSSYAKIKPDFGEDFYKNNKAIKDTFKDNLARKVKKVLDSLSGGLDEYLGIISTRLANIHPSLRSLLRRYEHNVKMSIKKDNDFFVNHSKKISKMSKEDLQEYGLALSNSDMVKVNEMNKKYGMEEEYNNTMKMDKEIFSRIKTVHKDVGEIENHFPRVVKDQDGLFEYYYGKTDRKQKDVLQEAFRKKSENLGRELTKEEKAGITASLLRGYTSQQIMLSKPGTIKSRLIDSLDAKTYQFYYDPATAMSIYIRTTNEDIETRKFFGKNLEAKEDGDINMTKSINSLVVELSDKYDIDTGKIIELNEILSARFNEVGTRGFVNWYKNLTLIDVLGNIFSTITQIGDIAFPVYKAPRDTVPALLKAITGKSEVKFSDLGYNDILEEYSDSSRMANAVRVVFKWTGFASFDKIGKETLINASLAKQRRQAKENSSELRKYLEPIFEEETNSVIEDLKKGKVTENVRLLLNNDLLDVQPVAKSEVPAKYLTGGNGRIFYSLKTWTIKALDVYRNETYNVMKTDKVQGTKNLLRLTFIMVAMGATTDEIKDWIMGREATFSDRVYDNLLKIIGLNRYSLDKASAEGLGTVGKNIIFPPTQLIDSLYKDIANPPEELKDLYTIKSVPMFGKIYYYWYGRGSNYQAKSSETMKKLPPLPKLPKLK